MQARITYLDNSGFAVKTRQHFLIFDCWNMQPEQGKTGLDGGTIDPAEIAGENVFVFVSHGHGDHYNSGIFKWSRQIENIHYILSDDIRGTKEALHTRPDERYDLIDIHIRTLRSTDEGVAFLIQTDGLTVYHAGDLNWWHWEGEDPDWNIQMGEDYRLEVGKLAKEKIDIAFIPVDPRLKADMLRGIEYFMDITDVKMVIPMHYGGDANMAEQAIKDAHIRHNERIIAPMKRGQTIVFKG